MADAIFKKYDVDSNGKIDLGEFTKLLTTEYGYDATKAKQVIADEFKKADTDKSGFITADEFAAAYPKLHKA